MRVCFRLGGLLGHVLLTLLISACPDLDGDGRPGVVSPFFDNCPTAANPDQQNSDAVEVPLTAPDLLGDACDECPHDEPLRFGAECENAPTYRSFSALDIDITGCGCEEELADPTASAFVSGGDVFVEEPIPSPNVILPGLCVWEPSFARVFGDECVPPPPPLPCDLPFCPPPAGFSLIERTCTLDGLTEQAVLCPFRCSDGACTCVGEDTDGGSDLFNRGSLPTGEVDSCVCWTDENDDGQADPSELEPVADCSADEGCDAGAACRLQEWRLTVVGDSCEVADGARVCAAGAVEIPCQAGACQCTDGDGGDPYTGGEMDSCDGDILVEHTRAVFGERCEDVLTEIPCAYGCAFDHCVCEDSDVGTNPYLQGVSATGELEQCADDGTAVLELSPRQCRPELAERIECPFGCIDGACQPPEGSPTFTVYCVPASWDDFGPAEEATLAAYCNDEFARFVRTSNLGAHLRPALEIVQDVFDLSGVPAVDFDGVVTHAGADPDSDLNVVVGVVPAPEAALFFEPGQVGAARAFAHPRSVFASATSELGEPVYAVSHELAHVLTRAPDLVVCDEDDFDNYSSLADPFTCVNDFPTPATAFEGDPFCIAEEDGVPGFPQCSGHAVDGRFDEPVQCIMGPVINVGRVLVREFDPDSLAHLEAAFDERAGR